MGVWRLNMEELNVADVTTFPTPPMSVSRKQRLDRRREKTNNPREGGQSLESKGWDLPRHTFVIKLVGDAQSVADELNFIVDQLETNKVVTLAAPDNEDAWAYLNKKRVALGIEDWDNDPSDMHAKQRIQLQSSVLGQWTQDGGDFYETLSIRFKQTDNTPTYEREDGSTQGDLTITLDAQDEGFPKAKNPTTLAFDQLSILSTGSRTLRNGDQVKTETYDLSGYLFPIDPSTTGDAGLATVRQSPRLGLLRTIAATLTSESVVTAQPDMPTMISAAIQAASALNADLLLIHEPSATASSTSQVTASATLFSETPIQATLTSPTSVTAVADIAKIAGATLQSASGVSAATRVLPVKASATLASASQVSAATEMVHVVSATLASASQVTGATVVGELFRATSSLTSASTVTASALADRPASASVTSTSQITANLALIAEAVATVASASTVTANAQVLQEATVDGFESGDLAAYSGDTS